MVIFNYNLKTKKMKNEVIIELKKLEVKPILTKCEELGVTYEHMIGFSGPGPHSYLFKGEENRLREALSVVLNEDELYDIFHD